MELGVTPPRALLYCVDWVCARFSELFLVDLRQERLMNIKKREELKDVLIYKFKEKYGENASSSMLFSIELSKVHTFNSAGFPLLLPRPPPYGYLRSLQSLLWLP